MESVEYVDRKEETSDHPAITDDKTWAKKKKKKKKRKKENGSAGR